MRLILCLFLFLSSVNASEINCKFHSFISEVNGVKTDHEIDEEDFMLIYYEEEPLGGSFVRSSHELFPAPWILSPGGFGDCLFWGSLIW